MPALELAEWRIFLAREPHGEQRADWRHAQATHVLALVNGNKQSKAADYFPEINWPDQ